METKKAKSRNFYISVPLRSSESKKPIITKDSIKIGLAHKTIAKWVFVLDKQEEKPQYKILLQMSTYTPAASIAEWFDIPEKYIEVITGRGVFIKYADLLIRGRDKKEIHANFDVKAEVRENKEGHELDGECIIIPTFGLSIQSLIEGGFITPQLLENWDVYTGNVTKTTNKITELNQITTA